MPDPPSVPALLKRHGVPFVVIGGHAVNFHGYGRATEDVDVLWLRTAISEKALFAALAEINAQYISDEIDLATGMERPARTSPRFSPRPLNTTAYPMCRYAGFGA